MTSASTSTPSTEPTLTHFRTCPLCEAGCGLAIETRGDQVVRIRGDHDDVFSHGFLCPKGSSLKQLHEDPDRLRRPLVKRNGVFEEVDWEEAWAVVDAGLSRVIAEHGRQSIATYAGNPNAHNLGAMMFGGNLAAGVGSRLRFSASTVDQMPKHVECGFVFGSPVAIPVPDLDRTDYLLILGANPYASNGSVCTAPDFPGRIERILERGGKVVVVDPRRSRTAQAATEHVMITPGTDALFLAALARTIADEHGVDLGVVAPYVNGIDAALCALDPFTPEAVALATGVDATVTRRVARDLAEAPTAAVYGRIGTTVAVFGTLASYLVDLINIITGNLDRPGGAMFAMPAAGGATTRGKKGSGRGFVTGKSATRVSGLPEVMGEYGVAALAEEIDTPGDGRIKALITQAGNPVLSTVNASRLDAALDQLDFMVSIDIYVNETTRHADVILPPPSTLQRSHYDLLLLQFAVRNVANYSPAIFEVPAGTPDEWEILVRLGLIARGMGDMAAADPATAVAAADDAGIDSLVRKSVGDENSSIHGRDPDEILASLGERRGPERLLDFQLRVGPFGDAFGTNPDGLNLARLEAEPHGVDLGALGPRIPEILRTPSGSIELANPVLIADFERLRRALTTRAANDDELLLVGRRDLRSNNSWMHNIGVLVKGKERCTLQIHPVDANRLGLAHGSQANVRSRVGEVTVPVDVTDGIMPGVVSIPHGYGHGVVGTQMAVAGAHRGVNTNVLSDEQLIDPLSSTSVLNGIPVVVSASPSSTV